MKQMMKIVGLVICSIGLASCNGGKNQTNIELIQDMMDQPSLKAQDWDPAYGDKGFMRTPPEGTIVRGRPPLAVHDPAQAGQLKNPLGDDQSPKVLELGKKNFEIYCMVCHGAQGRGDGIVASKMMIMKPPSLVSSKVRDFSDGRIFFIISQGQGLMGSYANQITNKKARWAVVNYIRNLQKNSAE